MNEEKTAVGYNHALLTSEFNERVVGNQFE